MAFDSRCRVSFPAFRALFWYYFWLWVEHTHVEAAQFPQVVRLLRREGPAQEDPEVGVAHHGVRRPRVQLGPLRVAPRAPPQEARGDVAERLPGLLPGCLVRGVQGLGGARAEGPSEDEPWVHVPVLLLQRAAEWRHALKPTSSQVRKFRSPSEEFMRSHGADEA